MKALLVRIGVDQAYGGWNAPVDAEGRFVYVPIPEKRDTPFHKGLERRYAEVSPALQRFCDDHACRLEKDLRFPESLTEYPMHLDPDFEYLTYGDEGGRRGARMVDMVEDDVLVFYGGLRPVHRCEQKLIYALMGIYFVREVLHVSSVPPARWIENAHVRKSNRGSTDIVIWAKPNVSGRMEKCIPIGEWRNGAYRVRPDLLEAWGGLSVKDGFVQRSAVPPAFDNPSKFLEWLQTQSIRFMQKNN